MAAVRLDGPDGASVRAYGLRSDTRSAVYLHHFECQQCGAEGRKPAGHPWQAACWNHDRGQAKDLKVTVELAQAGKGCWYDPASGAMLGRFDAPAGKATFTAPPFAIDLAMLISPDGVIDSDGDGRPNDIDDDDDNDGVPDAKDAFPLIADEWADADGNLIGDNLDADVDNDGKVDDLNHNGKPDNEEADFDGDGVPTAGAIPWDAFPRDPKEWRDTDGDGIGDNADDDDDDGDGFTDAEEKAAGTDPLNPVSFPRS